MNRPSANRLGELLRQRFAPGALLLHARPDRLTILSCCGTRPTVLAEFPGTQEGHAGFADFLTGKTDAELLLLADNGDETTAAAAIPKISGKDRQALIERKLEAHFPGMPFRFYAGSGRSEDSPRRERIFLAALARPALLAPWLSVIEREASALAGIYAPGQMDEHFLKAIPAGKGAMLLIVCDEQWIRQSFFIRGFRQFSRTSHLPTASAGDQALFIHDEADRLWQYLAAQNLLPAEHPAARAFIAPPALARALSALAASAGPDAAAIEIRERSSVLESCGLDPQLTWAQSSLALLARHRPTAQFAPPAQTANHRDRRLAARLSASAFGVLLAGCAFTIGSWSQAQSWLRQISAIEQEAATLKAAHADGAALRRDDGISPASQGPLLADHRKIVAQRRVMADLLTPLSLALNDADRIEVSRLTWQAADPNTPGLLVEGSIALGNGSDWEPTEEFAAFLNALKKLPAVATKVILHPLEANAITDPGNHRETAGSAPFKLRLDQRNRS